MLGFSSSIGFGGSEDDDILIFWILPWRLPKDT